MANIEKLVGDESRLELGQKINEIVDYKANKNLTNTGMITNCLTEIPQRIKYTLEDGTLTIKAGSVVIVPYGTEDLSSTYPVGATFLNDNFKVYDTQFADGKFFVWAELVEDIVRAAISTTSTSERWAFFEIDLNNYDAFGTGVSGTEAVTNSICYRTDLNKCVCYNSSGAVKSEACCLPFMKVLANGVYIEGSIKQVFNGFGYIGSTIWSDKGIKGLIPNDINPDGTLQNIDFRRDKLLVYTSQWGNKSVIFALTLNGYTWANSEAFHYVADFTKLPDVSVASFAYVKRKNKWFIANANNDFAWTEFNDQFCPVLNLVAENNKITTFDPKSPFIAVDYNDITYIVETYIKGTSWVIVYSNGRIEQGGRITTSGAVGAKELKVLGVTFIRPYTNENTINVGAIPNSPVFTTTLSSLSTTNVNFGFKNTNTNNSDSALTSVQWWASGY